MKILAQLTGIDSPSSIFTDSNTLPQKLSSRFLVYATALSGLFFFVRLVISGYLYLTSAGDPGKVQSATKNLLNSVLGLFTVLMAFFIAQVVFAIFGIGGITTT